MLNFDELISNGELTKAARFFAKEYYDSGRMGHTRRLLIERLADKCDKYDEAVARQSVKSEDVQEAIEQIESLIKAIGNDMHWRSDKLMESLDLAITALQAYEPTTRNNRTVEEVAEAIKQKVIIDAMNYLNKNMKQPFTE